MQFRLIVGCCAGFLLPSCFPGVQWTGTQTEPLAKLESPGYFDIGTGFGYYTSDPLDSSDGAGLLLSVKAYPAGRWFSRKKSATRDVLESAASAIVNQTLVLQSIKKQADLEGPDALAYVNAVLAAGKLMGSIAASTTAEVDALMPKVLAGVANVRLPENVVDRKAPLKSMVTAALDELPPQAIADWVVTVLKKSPDGGGATTFKAPIPGVAALGNSGSSDPSKGLLTAAQTFGTTKVEFDAEKLTQFTTGYLDALRDTPSSEWIVADERTKFYHRLSVFYGHTLGNLKGGVDDNAHVVGVGYDIAPQFAVIAGFAFVDNKDDTDSGLFLGTSLNLSTFKDAFKGIVGGN